MIIDIDYDAASEIIVSTLKEDYISLTEQINALKRKKKAGTILKHELEDLRYNKKYRKGIETSLRYYMPISEAKSFIKYIKESKKNYFSSWDDDIFKKSNIPMYID
jgi:hypothetical protein